MNQPMYTVQYGTMYNSIYCTCDVRDFVSHHDAHFIFHSQLKNISC